MYTRGKKETPRTQIKQLSEYVNLSLQDEIAYAIPVQTVSEHLYADIDKLNHEYDEIPDRKDNVYEEVSESLYHDVQNYPVAEGFDDETFNTNWRPTTTKRNPEVIRGIDLFPTKESDQDKKTFSLEKITALRAEIKLIKTESEAIAYAKKEGYKVITQSKPTHRFYFKCGEKSKNYTFNKTNQEIAVEVKKQLYKRDNNPKPAKFFEPTAKVWILY